MDSYEADQLSLLHQVLACEPDETTKQDTQQALASCILRLLAAMTLEWAPAAVTPGPHSRIRPDARLQLVIRLLTALLACGCNGWLELQPFTKVNTMPARTCACCEDPALVTLATTVCRTCSYDFVRLLRYSFP